MTAPGGPCGQEMTQAEKVQRTREQQIHDGELIKQLFDRIQLLTDRVVELERQAGVMAPPQPGQLMPLEDATCRIGSEPAHLQPTKAAW